MKYVKSIRLVTLKTLLNQLSTVRAYVCVYVCFVFQINFFDIILHQYHQHVKQFEPNLGPTKRRRAWSRSKLFGLSIFYSDLFVQD